MALLGDEDETRYQEDVHEIEIAGVGDGYVFLNVELAWFEVAGGQEWPSHPTSPFDYSRQNVCLRVESGVIPFSISLTDGNELREAVRERIEMRDREEEPPR